MEHTLFKELSSSSPQLKARESIFSNSLRSPEPKKTRTAGMNKYKWAVVDPNGKVLKVYDVRRDAMANTTDRHGTGLKVKRITPGAIGDEG